MIKKEKIPPLLETGSKVAVVAPSGYVDINNIQNAIGILKSWGLNTIEGDSLYKRNGIFAGSDSERLADLQKAIDDKDIKAIICARGGYGLSRIIDRLDLKALQEFPKWICGFSDITILHYYVMKELAMPVIHSPMLLSFARRADSESINSLRKILFEGQSAFQWDSDNLQNGETKSVLAGGNLSLLYSLLGLGLSDYMAGKILFIEDTGEHLYRLDRMLMSLGLA
ncbi:MAG: LD-carboxypeptidase, partial [Bacteroidales bacterium]|nr:LD-carboxypeptidase [Bacteroidales bacterium]